MYDLKVFKKQVGFGEDKIERKKTIWVLSALLVCRVTIFLWSVCVCLQGGRGMFMWLKVTAQIHVSTTSVCVRVCACDLWICVKVSQGFSWLEGCLTDVWRPVCVCECVCIAMPQSCFFFLRLSSVGFSTDWLDLHCWIHAGIIIENRGKKCGKIL